MAKEWMPEKLKRHTRYPMREQCTTDCPDRLTAEVDRWQKLANKEYWGRVSQEEANKALQSQLDMISEPYHYSRDKAEYPWIRHEGKADGCPICRLKPLSEKLP